MPVLRVSPRAEDGGDVMTKEELDRELRAAENTLRHYNIPYEVKKVPRPKLQLIRGGKS